MNKKNNFKIILIAIVLIIAVLSFVETVTYLYGIKKAKEENLVFKNRFNIPPYHTKIISFNKFYNNVYKKRLIRKPEGLNHEKRPIILFGDSFTYGYGLKYNQIFSYKLAHYAKRPVYNRGFSNWAPQYMLYQLENEPDLNNIQNPQYIIYTIINVQINKLYTFSYSPESKIFYLKYIEKDNKLVPAKPILPFLYKLYSIRTLDKHFGMQASLQNQEANNRFLKLCFLQSKKLAEEKYPDVKFVILIYLFNKDSSLLDLPVWQELKEKGFIILNTTELTGINLFQPEYTLSQHDIHPNEKAWDIIVPAIVKNLAL